MASGHRDEGHKINFTHANTEIWKHTNTREIQIRIWTEKLSATHRVWEPKPTQGSSSPGLRAVLLQCVAQNLWIEMHGMGKGAQALWVCLGVGQLEDDHPGSREWCRVWDTCAKTASSCFSVPSTSACSLCLCFNRCMVVGSTAGLLLLYCDNALTFLGTYPQVLWNIPQSDHPHLGEDHRYENSCFLTLEGEGSIGR